MARIDRDTLAILSGCSIEGSFVRIEQQLPREQYQAVNKVLAAAGGQWNRHAKAHIFDGLARDALEPILLTGEVRKTKQEFGQFDSPPDVVDQVIKLARVEPGMKVFEPSAGIGNIVRALLTVPDVQCFANEIDPKRAEMVKALLPTDRVTCRDFLSIDAAPVFDIVAMNPPFPKQADIAHVTHAAGFLRPGGRLVSVMSAGVTFRRDSRTKQFIQLLEKRHGTMTMLPDDSFKESGTSVSTCIVTLEA